MAGKHTAFGKENDFQDFVREGIHIGRSRDQDSLKNHLQNLVGDDLVEMQRSAVTVQSLFQYL